MNQKLIERKTPVSFFFFQSCLDFCFFLWYMFVLPTGRKRSEIMQNSLKKIGARVYLYEKDALIKRITYVYEDGIESESLPRYIHLGMFTDSILFGEECQIRFFVYPFSLRLYDTDVDCLEFINGSDRTVSISCFGQEIILAPEESGKLVNNGKKFKHSTEE